MSIGLRLDLKDHTTSTSTHLEWHNGHLTPTTDDTPKKPMIIMTPVNVPVLVRIETGNQSAATPPVPVDSFTTPRPAARWLHQVFETTCDAVPSTVALECEQTRVNYAELDAQANQLAHHLPS